MAHLTGGASFKNDIITFKHESHQFTEKEKSILTYLSGYVFGTFYRRIRFSSKVSTLHHKLCLSFLLAGKCTGETVSGATTVSRLPFFMIDYDREFYANSEKYKNIDLKINQKYSKSTSKF